MPFINKAVADARRAAAASRPATNSTPQSEHQAEGSRTPPAPTQPQDDAPAAPSSRTPPRRRGHAIKDERGKYLPTGNYPSGFARPPEDGQFQKGGKAGPGRPKGSKSLDALLIKHLKQMREVTIGGRRKKVPTGELVVMALVKAALEGKDRHARGYALEQMARLSAERDPGAGVGGAVTLNDSDALSLAEFEAEIRGKILAELNQAPHAEGDRP